MNGQGAGGMLDRDDDDMPPGAVETSGAARHL